MRRMLVYVAMALALSMAAYLGFGADAYVLIRAGETALQMTIWIAVIWVAVLLVLASLVWAIISGAFFGGWRKAWLRRRQEKLTSSAVKSYTDQDWPKAYKQLVKLANSHDNPEPYVIMAAEAAVASGDIEKGRETFSKALAQFPDNSFQIRLRLGYLELGIGNQDKAEELCNQLVSEKKRDPDARLLEILIAEDNGDWQQMYDLLLKAKSHKVLSARLPTIERRYLRSCLAEKPSAPLLINLADLIAASPAIPEVLCIDLAQQLAMKGQADKAEQFLRKRIDISWEPSLVEAYGNIEGKSVKGQIKAAESWLVANPKDKVLLDSLVKLSLKAGDEQRVDTYQQKLVGS